MVGTFQNQVDDEQPKQFDKIKHIKRDFKLNNRMKLMAGG